ncbi:23S rRNA (cytosine1962-C5)-methyltransferase [Aquimarina sp. EL_43]|uniref:class I SAM-dependent rRNA methyltransferase n=1 Tax=unclassified Aquimarina TaxID=2627091 RepID=UPI0018CBC861|nr:MULTISPECIES: class I SAM-dependent rRNA methyltransferase [unclassified Aquimarina]MBG6129668.1 23S rRNA (cytosine1962-C5)-methyltransferase [Aquimarina sp. EL_35]MBG6150733.1 23S rRNA (cytosine1962-C5)-methyltransferase [Aquimarina sp. EL_32]MBG6167960.1 23S rRNA (cytosine1962-C5)-methyltransferase [Aquimarina sp. EL_43]
MNIVPEITTKRLAVKVRPSAEKIIKQRHPWVFEDSIIKQNVEGEAGDLVIVYDTKKNTFLACGLYDPYSPIRIKLIQFRKTAQINTTWFAEKISEAYEKRIPLLETDTNSYRLLFGENDHLPGCIADVYDQVLVIKLYSHIWFPYLNWIIEHLVAVSGCKCVVLRLSRLLQSKGEVYDLKDGQVIYGTLKNEVVVFREHGVLFSANVIKGHKTGYFLDHRHNRKRVGELAYDKTLLDVFSYAGGFSVHALKGGARKVVSLDISKQALDMAKENVALNVHKGKHDVIVADAFDGLQKLIDQKIVFDIVVIDPPSFAKKASEIHKAMISYARLAELGSYLVSPNGILVLASCSSRILAEDFFKISEESILKSGRKFNMLEKTNHDIDHPISFPEGAYLKCGYYRLD